MARATRGVKGRRRHKKWLKLAKGAFGRRSKIIKAAKATAEKGLQHAYVSRKLKKRQYRALWIVRINAAARANGLSYSRLIAGLRRADVAIDRKMLAYLSVHDPKVMTDICNVAKEATAAA